MAARTEPGSPSPTMPPTCPKRRFTTVAYGQQRSAPVGPKLHNRPRRGGRTVLPKLAVLVLLGRPGLGTADRRLLLV
jgi:hypothetical protein